MRNTAVIKTNKKQRITAIILAAGLSSKMKSYGARSLIRLPNTITLIEHQINVIRDTFPNVEIILVTGVEADKVMNSTPPDIIKIENENHENTSSIRSLALGLRAMTSDRLLTVFGDLVFNYETLNNMEYKESGMLLDTSGLMNNETTGCILNEANFIESMSYDIPNKWSQIGYFAGKELSLLKNISWSRNKDNFLMYEMLNDIISRGGKFKALKSAGMKLFDVDSARDLRLLKEI